MSGPTLDTCIAGTFTPGNIASSTGQTPVSPSVPSLLDPDDYDPDSVDSRLDYSKFYNSGYLLLLIF